MHGGWRCGKQAMRMTWRGGHVLPLGDERAALDNDETVGKVMGCGMR
jgi:hypothetical protein